MLWCRFTVGPGNNRALIVQTAARRSWWVEADDDADVTSLDLRWQQVRSRDAAEKVKKAGNKTLLNHHEGLNCLCRKSELYKCASHTPQRNRQRQSAGTPLLVLDTTP